MYFLGFISTRLDSEMSFPRTPIFASKGDDRYVISRSDRHWFVKMDTRTKYPANPLRFKPGAQSLLSSTEPRRTPST